MLTLDSAQVMFKNLFKKYNEGFSQTVNHSKFHETRHFQAHQQIYSSSMEHKQTHQAFIQIILSRHTIIFIKGGTQTQQA